MTDAETSTERKRRQARERRQRCDDRKDNSVLHVTMEVPADTRDRLVDRGFLDFSESDNREHVADALLKSANGE